MVYDLTLLVPELLTRILPTANFQYITTFNDQNAVIQFVKLKVLLGYIPNYTPIKLLACDTANERAL